MFRFSDVNIEIQGEHESVTEKITLDGKEMSENKNDTERETEYASVGDPLRMHNSKKTTLISGILNMIKILRYVQSEKI